MTPSSVLFDLIQSLSRSEKTYFKKFSRLHTLGAQNKYVLLFDAIAKQKDYDEKKLLTKFKTYEFRQFPVAKNYLYNQILYALAAYHNSTHAEVYHLLHRIEILYERGLYKQALKEIHKAKQLATENELHNLVLVVLQWEHNLATRKLDLNWFKQIQREEKNAWNILKNIKIYKDLRDRLFYFYRSHGEARNKKHLKALEKFIKNHNLSDESRAKTVDTKLQFYHIHSLYNFIAGNHKKAYLCNVNQFCIYQKHPERKKLNSSSYLAFLFNLCLTGMDAKKYSDIPLYLKEFEQLESITKSTTQRLLLFVRYKYSLLNFMNKTGQFTNAEAELQKIIKQLKQYENKLSNEHKELLFESMALVYFGMGHYNKSIFWLNRIRNEISQTYAPNIESSLRILYLIVHYEAGHDDLLPYQIQSTYRFLRKKQQLYKFETIVINFLRNKIPLVNSPKQLINYFIKLKSQLMPLVNDPNEKNAFAFFDYISWLESKIENRPFAEIIREKALQAQGN